jgi:hypothetical protein
MLHKLDFRALLALALATPVSGARVRRCQRHLTEAAVMLAYGTVPKLQKVELHPDGEHGKRFEIT